MKLLISKKSGKPFVPPFEGDGKTTIAIGKIVNMNDPKRREAYVLENGSIVNCDLCNVIKDFESMNNFDEIANNITNEFDDMLNSITDEDFAELLDASATSGPTVEEYMSNFKVCIFPNFMVEQIKELITFYRKNNTDMSQVVMYNLDDIEKNLNTAINWNDFHK